MATLNVQIDSELKRRLNVRAAEKDIPQKDLVSQILKAELDNPREELEAENESLRDELIDKDMKIKELKDAAGFERIGELS